LLARKAWFDAAGGVSLPEVLILVGTFAMLLGVVALYMVRKKHPSRKAMEIRCFSNLEQIGLGVRMWANDHGDEFPWRVSTNQGGSKEFLETRDVFRHFVTLSNELNSPRALTCPFDRQRTPTTSFVARLSNRNVSYFLNRDLNENLPETLLSGDRNITGGTFTKANLLLVTSNRASWDRSIHNNCGNIGLGDGSVRSTTTESLRKLLASEQMARQTNVTRLALPLTP
jgi:hypothetical protein